MRISFFEESAAKSGETKTFNLGECTDFVSKPLNIYTVETMRI